MVLGKYKLSVTMLRIVVEVFIPQEEAEDTQSIEDEDRCGELISTGRKFSMSAE